MYVPWPSPIINAIPFFQSNIILHVITEFTNDYRTNIDGTSNDFSSDELCGGARISFVFHEIYGQAIRTMDPFDQIKDVDIRTILYNSSVNYFFGGKSVVTF